MTGLLFLAAAPAPYGEAVRGLELAREAAAAGHRIAFLHPRRLAPLFAGAPFSCGILDDVLPTLVEAVRDTVRARGLGVVVLVDAISVFGVLGAAGLRALVATCGARVIALDLWSCHETDLAWDLGAHTSHLDPLLLELPTLRPCPIARPEAPGAYRAIAEPRPDEPGARARTRRRLGIGPTERVLFVATGSWQAAAAYPAGEARRLAAAWPGALALLRRRLAPARLLHVGPTSFDLGEGYLHVPQVGGAEFRDLLAASDVMIGNNAIATSLATALALDVPAVVIGATTSIATLDAHLATRAGELAEDVRAWLEALLPVRAHAVAPLGLAGFLAPVLTANPFTDAITRCELVDPDATASRIRALLEDGGAARAARAAYRARVAALPSGLARLRELTA